MLWDFLSQILVSFTASPSGGEKWKYGKVRYNLGLRAVIILCCGVSVFITALYLISHRSSGYSTFVLCVFLSMTALSLVLFGKFCIWKIDYDDVKIVFRTAFGRKHIIPYEEITSVYSNPYSNNGDGEIKITSGKIRIAFSVKSCVGAKEFLYFCRKYIPFQL